VNDTATLASSTSADADELGLYLVVAALHQPLSRAEAAQLREALAGAASCGEAMVCNAAGNPLAAPTDPDRDRCGLVVAQCRAEDGIDAMEAVLALIPREEAELGLVGAEVREIDTVAVQQ
jgi:hypothetical protein